MSDTGDPAGDGGAGLPPDLRFLKWLVTALAATMMVGLIALVAVFVTRFPGAAPLPALPEGVILPDGATPEAVTFGRGWVAVVAGDRILVFDAEGGEVLNDLVIGR